MNSPIRRSVFPPLPELPPHDWGGALLRPYWLPPPSFPLHPAAQNPHSAAQNRHYATWMSSYAAWDDHYAIWRSSYAVPMSDYVIQDDHYAARKYHCAIQRFHSAIEERYFGIQDRHGTSFRTTTSSFRTAGQPFRTATSRHRAVGYAYRTPARPFYAVTEAPMGTASGNKTGTLREYCGGPVVPRSHSPFPWYSRRDSTPRCVLQAPRNPHVDGQISELARGGHGTDREVTRQGAEPRAGG